MNTFSNEEPDDLAQAELAVCTAAREGELSRYLSENPLAGHAALYAMINDLVYQRLTRRVERERGHYACMASVHRLAPDCHDRHQDDVEAVRAYVLMHAEERIENLPGWLTTRIQAATVDAYRRRRGQQGALQRPRLPGWLCQQIGEDPWLRRLALNIMEWVGVPGPAPGGGLWPLRAWVEQRARAVSGERISEAEVAVEVEQVLAAMRARPRWFADYIDRPLGKKQVPVLTASVPGGAEPEPASRMIVEQEATELLLQELASSALLAVKERVERGDDVRAVVPHVLRTVFGKTAAEQEMAQVPGTGKSGYERAHELVVDQDVLDQVTAAVLEIINGS